MNKVIKAGILVVDPARSLRNSLKEMLSYEGFDVDTCETLDEGYAMSRSKGYDLMLIDGDLAEEHTTSARQGAFGNVSPIILSASMVLRFSASVL